MKVSLSILLFVVAGIHVPPVLAKCTFFGNVQMQDPCNEAHKKPRQNSFDESNTPNSRMSEADMARDRQKELDRQTILDMQRQVDEENRARRAAVIRRQQEQEREIAMRQQEIDARNRQAAAIESAAASAEAARQAAIAAQNAAETAAKNQRRVVAPAPRIMHCNPNNGWCD